MTQPKDNDSSLHMTFDTSVFYKIGQFPFTVGQELR